MPHEVGITWTYDGDGHLRGMAEAGTPGTEPGHLRAAVAALTGGTVRHEDGTPPVIGATGWLPTKEDVPPYPRLHVRVWGAIFAGPGARLLA